uniref:Uncharacterized protein n=1 Tax=Panagrellus redivivus TaxID=6233 RepID=A0A7E4W6A9_PANRE
MYLKKPNEFTSKKAMNERTMLGNTIFPFIIPSFTTNRTSLSIKISSLYYIRRCLLLYVTLRAMRRRFLSDGLVSLI